MHYCHLVAGLMAWKHRCSQIISLSRWHQTRVKQRSGKPCASASEVGRVSPALCLNIWQILGFLPELIICWWWSRSGMFFTERVPFLPLFFKAVTIVLHSFAGKKPWYSLNYSDKRNLLNMKVQNFGGISGVISPASKVNGELKTFRRGQNSQLVV